LGCSVSHSRRKEKRRAYLEVALVAGKGLGEDRTMAPPLAQSSLLEAGAALASAAAASHARDAAVATAPPLEQRAADSLLTSHCARCPWAPSPILIWENGILLRRQGGSDGARQDSPGAQRR